MSFITMNPTAIDAAKKEVEAVVIAWVNGLDSGDLEEMVYYTADSVVICNERTATSVGVQAFRDKYVPRMAAMNFESTCTTQHIQVMGDFAMWIGRFTAEAKAKQTGETMKQASGRLILAFQKIDGVWKVILDVDNNDETDAMPTPESA